MTFRSVQASVFICVGALGVALACSPGAGAGGDGDSGDGDSGDGQENGFGNVAGR